MLNYDTHSKIVTPNAYIRDRSHITPASREVEASDMGVSDLPGLSLLYCTTF